MAARGNIDDEASLYRKAAGWIEEGKDLIAQFRRAGLAMPTPLLRVSGDDETKPTPTSDAGIVAEELDTPTVPPTEFETGWAWVKADAEMVQVRSLVLAMLRQAGRALSQRDLATKMQLLRDVAPNSLANASAALVHQGSVERTDDGIVLAKPDRAPILHDGYLWGPPAVFGVHELAAYRREAVLHLLGQNPQGLRIIDLSSALADAKWIKAPCDKASIKADLMALKPEGVRQATDGSFRWHINGGSK